MPTVLLASAAVIAPSVAFADEGGTDGDAPSAPAVVETTVESDPKPEPKPEPKADPAPPAPEPEEAPEPEPKAEPEPKEEPEPRTGQDPAPKSKSVTQKASSTPAGEAADDGARQVRAEDVVLADEVNEKKVVVCKYVTTPGGELDHIIIVSIASLDDFPDPPVFPWTFTDAHDSVAIRFAAEGEQAKDVAEAECAPAQAPTVIDPPELDLIDPCGVGNAEWGAVPASDNYAVVRHDDGSITLTAADGFVFSGTPTTSTYEYPVPVETNTEDCPVDDKKVVVCKFVSTPGGVLDHIIIVSVASLDGFPDPPEFPWTFGDAQDSVAIRFAKEGEQAKDVAEVECVPEEEPEVITPPELDVIDPCGEGNAVWDEVPESDDYAVVRHDDGSITLTAADGFVFAGDPPTTTHDYPAPVETNTEPCPVSATIVACVSPADVMVARQAPVPLGVVQLIDEAVAAANGFAGSFPFSYTDGDSLVKLIRYAAEGETAAEIDALELCGEVGGIVEVPPTSPNNPNNPTPTVAGTPPAVLPNTGGPANWLLLFGVGLVLGGAALVMVRRPHAA